MRRVKYKNYEDLQFYLLASFGYLMLDKSFTLSVFEHNDKSFPRLHSILSKSAKFTNKTEKYENPKLGTKMLVNI